MTGFVELFSKLVVSTRKEQQDQEYSKKNGGGK